MINAMIVRGTMIIDAVIKDPDMTDEIKAYINSTAVAILEPTFEYLEKLKDNKGIELIDDPQRIAKALRDLFEKAEKAGIIRRKDDKEKKDDTKEDDNPTE